MQDKDIEFETVEIAEGVVLFKGRITGQEAANLLEDDRAEANDLIPGVYEGTCMGVPNCRDAIIGIASRVNWIQGGHLGDLEQVKNSCKTMP